MAEETTLTINLTVAGADGAPRVPLTISKSISPSALRKAASEKTKVPLGSLKVIFRGRLIADDDSKQAVTEYKLEEGSVVHCMGKPVSDEAPATVSVQTSNSFQPSLNFMPPNVAAAASAQPRPVILPADPLQAALQILRSSCSPDDYVTALSTLEKILSNIANNPMEEKYRRVKKQNAAFQRRLGGRNGGDAAMRAAGFQTRQDDGEEVYLIEASAEAWPKLMADIASLEAAIREAKAATSQATVPPQLSGLPRVGGSAGMPPDMNQVASDFMSNPAQLQAMLQNPMVQNMIRNHPQFANNPMAQQMLEQMATNPAVLAQMSQMMQDPAMMSRMQAMAQHAPAGGGFGNMGTAAAFPPSAQPGNGNQGRAPAVSDEEMTEEEMIAEAIRRSLQEG